MLRRGETLRTTFLRSDKARAKHLTNLDGSTWMRHVRPDTRANRASMFLDLEDLGEIRSAFDAHALLEERDPTADRRVLEFALGVPDEQHTRAGAGRILVRRAFAAELPESILAGRKRGLQAAAAVERLRPHLADMHSFTAELSRNELASSLLDLRGIHAALTKIEEDKNAINALAQMDRVLVALALGGYCRWHARKVNSPLP